MQENELSVGDSVRVLGLDDGTPWERAGGTIKALPTQGHEGEYLIFADHPLNHRLVQGKERWIPRRALLIGN